ncbi:MAG: 50S ribosomal protein L17 [bacterium]|nr:50S ribosomal protein L17 [bacterium]
MRHLKKARKLGRTTSHRKAMFSNLTTSLFRHGKITTTEAKAKELIRVASQMITTARGEHPLHARRQVLKLIKDNEVVKVLFDEIAPRFKDRPGGYLRVIKAGQRHGDAAQLAIVELIEGA